MSEPKNTTKIVGLKFRIAEIHKAMERTTYVYKGIKEPTSMLEFLAFNYELQWVIAQMENKLFETKEKFPEKDYSDAELKIKILQDYMGVMHKVLEENRTLNGLVFKVTKEFHIKNDQIERLEKENVALKKALEENTPIIGKRQINYE